MPINLFLGGGHSRVVQPETATAPRDAEVRRPTSSASAAGGDGVSGGGRREADGASRQAMEGGASSSGGGYRPVTGGSGAGGFTGVRGAFQASGRPVPWRQFGRTARRQELARRRLCREVAGMVSRGLRLGGRVWWWLLGLRRGETSVKPAGATEPSEMRPAPSGPIQERGRVEVGVP